MLCSLTGSQPPVTQKDILSTTTTDKVLTMLMTKIEKGFPETKAELEQEIQPYWRVKDMLSAYNGVIYKGDRVVMPEELRSRTLDTLHAAHQGTTSMRLRAERNLFWPNMARDIATKCMSCITCDETAPSQSPEPPMTPIHPEYPFQHICSDFFSLQGHNFCLVVDRFSNWLQVFTGKGGAHNLISILGQCFHSFGIPETLTSDGGPEYTAGNTQEFLRKLGVHHRLTSVGFPHTNQKAEKSVGSAKRWLIGGSWHWHPGQPRCTTSCSRGPRSCRPSRSVTMSCYKTNSAISRNVGTREVWWSRLTPRPGSTRLWPSAPGG
jgi:hypothetical protein